MNSVLILLLICHVFPLQTMIVSLSRDQLLNFIHDPSFSSEDDCTSALEQMAQSYNQSEEQKRNFLASSFALGPTSDYRNRDHAKWIYKSLECVNSVNGDRPIRDYCFAGNNQGMTASVCIPRACKSHRSHFLVNLPEYQSTGGLPENSSFTASTKPKLNDQIQCLGSRWDTPWYLKPMPVFDLFFLQIVMMLLVLIGTFYEIYRQKRYPTEVIPSGAAKRLLLCFSLKTNMKRLFRVPSDPKSTITCVCGLRFAATVWTLVGHAYMAMQIVLSNSDQFVEDLRDNFLAQTITNFTLAVDAFFVISGSLTTYSWFRRFQKNPLEQEPSWHSLKYWLKFYRHRVIRLWPAYAAVLWMVTMRFSYNLSHPLWPLVDASVQCKTHFWENLLFLNSLFPNVCLIWHWYLGTEFIFYLIVPIFLLSLRRSPVLGFILAISVTCISAALRAGLTAAYNFPPTQFLWVQPEIFNPDIYGQHIIVYTKPYTRIGPYLVGVLLGYVLCHIKAMQVDHMTTFKKVLGWIFCAIGFSWALFGLYPALQGWDWHIYHLIYAAIHRTVFALAIAWIIFACYAGHGALLNTALSWKWIVPLANLSYGSYLFHLVTIVAVYHWLPFPLEWHGHWQGASHVLLHLIFSYGSGLYISCIYELPPLNMEAMFLLKRKTVAEPANTEIKTLEACQRLTANSEMTGDDIQKDVSTQI